MKTNQFFLTFVGLLLASLTTFGQVKIGNNYTTISSNSNLEVEAAASGTATTGNKFLVDKTTGQVTIQDGTQGDGKILTSDANGNASWKQLGGQTGAGFDSYLTPSAAFNINYSNPSTNVFPFPNVTISESGTYMAIVRTFGQVSVASPTVAFYTMIRKNGITTGQDLFEWYCSVGSNYLFGVSGTLIFTANAGDVVTVGFANGYTTQPSITVAAAYLPRNNVRFVKIR